MVTIKEALSLLEAGFTVEDIRAMDTAPDPKPDDEQKPDPKPEQKPDPRIDALTSTIEKLVETVGKMPFFASMGQPSSDSDTDAILASIINPPRKDD